MPSHIHLDSFLLDNLCLKSLGSGCLRVNLLSILVVSNSWGRSTVSSAFARSDSDNLAVNGARDAVLQLQVHLGNGVVCEDGGIGNITYTGSNSSIFHLFPPIKKRHGF